MCSFPVNPAATTDLVVSVHDQNLSVADKEIGHAWLSLRGVYAAGRQELVVHLLTDKGKPAGDLFLVSGAPGPGGVLCAAQAAGCPA